MSSPPPSAPAEKKHIQAPTIIPSYVLHLSPPPAFMTPQKLRHILEQAAIQVAAKRPTTGTTHVKRIYLQAEDAKITKRRGKSGGARRVKYTEGWVEFSEKKIAKRVAEAWNGKIIGGKSTSFHHDDIMNLRYLSGFKWRHLSEETLQRRSNRDSKLSTEIERMNRENSFYRQNVAKAKMMENIRNKKRARGDKSIPEEDSEANREVMRKKFRQRKVHRDEDATDDTRLNEVISDLI